MKLVYNIILLSLLSSSALAQEKKEIHWYLADVPAVHIVEGEKKEKGFIDQVLYQQIIPKLPQYKHVVQAVPVGRREGKWVSDTTACAPGIFKNGDRGGKILFSNPYLATLSPGIFARKSARIEILRYADKAGKVNFAALLKGQQIIVGTVAGRSYGADIDRLLRPYEKQKNIFEMTSKNGAENLLKMMKKKRIDVVLANPYEPAFMESESQSDFRFWPLLEQAPYQLVYAACSNTPEGAKAVKDLNGVFAQPSVRHEAHRYFEGWLKKEDISIARAVQEKAATEYK